MKSIRKTIETAEITAKTESNHEKHAGVENAQAKRSSLGSIPSSSLGSEELIFDRILGDKNQKSIGTASLARPWEWVREGRKSSRPLPPQLYSGSRGGSGGKWGNMEYFLREKRTRQA
jgi:hypothetical protein